VFTSRIRQGRRAHPFATSIPAVDLFEHRERFIFVDVGTTRSRRPASCIGDLSGLYSAADAMTPENGRHPILSAMAW